MELGHLFQKLALWMDALEMYVHVDELAERRLDDLHLADQRRKTRALRTSLKELRIAAQYRRTIALGWGDLLARQWMRGEPETKKDCRARDKHLARARLEQPLLDLFDDAGDAAGLTPADRDEWRDQLAHLLRQPCSEPWASSPTMAEGCLRLLFQTLALQSARRHAKAMRLRRMLDPHTLWITETTWALFREWTHYRLHEAYWSLTYLRHRAQPPFPAVTSAERRLCGVAGALTRKWRKAPHQSKELPGDDWDGFVSTERAAAAAYLRERTRRFVNAQRPSRDGATPNPSGGPAWLDHYNAACVYLTPATIPVRAPDTPPTPGQETLNDTDAEYVVEELRAAIRKLDPGELFGIAPWVCSEDPDLKPLREHPAFARFAARQFPGRMAEVERPPDAHLMELALYTTRGGRHAARQLAEEWRRRGESPPPRGRALETLWREERLAWESVTAVAEHYKHWRTRLRLAQQMNEWARRRRRSPQQWRYPLFDGDAKDLLDQWLACRNGQDGDSDLDLSEVRRWVACSDARLRCVHSEVASRKPLGRLLEAECKLADDGRSLTALQWRRLATAHADLWQCLAAWLSDDCLTEPSHESSPTTRQCTHHQRFQQKVTVAEDVLSRSAPFSSTRLWLATRCSGGEQSTPPFLRRRQRLRRDHES